jgi:hypothetical protein
LIEIRHVIKSLRESKPIEHQLADRYGSIFNSMNKDSSVVLDANAADRSYG